MYSYFPFGGWGGGSSLFQLPNRILCALHFISFPFPLFNNFRGQYSIKYKKVWFVTGTVFLIINSIRNFITVFHVSESKYIVCVDLSIFAFWILVFFLHPLSLVWWNEKEAIWFVLHGPHLCYSPVSLDLAVREFL